MYNSDKKILYLITLLIFEKKVSTIKEFCARIEMVESTISKIKKEKAHFTAFYIERICNEFNVNANWIFSLENEVYNKKKDTRF